MTIVAVPWYQLDVLSLTLEDSSGNTLASSELSNDSSFINWIQIRVSAGSQLSVHVKLVSTPYFSYWQHSYVLYVVGSTSALLRTSVAGPQVQSY